MTGLAWYEIILLPELIALGLLAWPVVMVHETIVRARDKRFDSNEDQHR